MALIKEKKCIYCKHMNNFCAIYIEVGKIATLLNMNLDKNPLDESPYQYIINEVAHNCKRFELFEEDIS